MTKDTLSKWKNATNVPIGSAISGTRGYVLNNQGQLCPQGAIGELYLAGDGLASSYLEQSQTQAAFSQKQFIVGDIEVNERLYKTGDMVRYNQDDELEFIGRKDNQIKLRGFRVELNEIEEVINQHPQVKQSCVLVKEDEQGNKHLITCYQANAELSEELQAHCQQQLLAHQIPALYSQIEEFPLTANGKLDRNKILQRNEFNFSDAQGTYTEPESKLEQLLCEIWQQALNLEQVGTTDNFFRLGGHSLIAVNVLAQISDKFAVDLDLAELFKSPSIKGIVKLITQYQDETEAKGTGQSENTVQEILAEDLSDDELDALLATMEGDE
jgi:acyl carrier protein